jgi:hypothetical protein
MKSVEYTVWYRVRDRALVNIWTSVKSPVWSLVRHNVGDRIVGRVMIRVRDSVESNVENPQQIPRSVMCSALGSAKEAS